MISSKIYLLAFVVLFSKLTFSQMITSGKILYERKTNLMKKFTDERAKRFINDNNKNKIDQFELYFSDTMSVFLPVEVVGEKQDMMSWATNKNSVIQNNITGTRLSILSIWGEKAYVQDSVIKRRWKVTENKRKIGKYNCTKAIFELNDTTRIYAWFSEDIIPSIGPETFRGLPGAILGLATEDGGVVYYARSVEAMKPDFETIVPKIGKQKTYTHQQLKDKLQADFGDKPWGKGIVEEMFMW